MRLRASFCAVSLFVSATLGCSRAVPGSTIKVAPLQVAATPPGRVLALVSVTKGGSAAEDLGPENFEVRESAVTLDPSLVQLRVQQLGELRGHEAVVLVDGSRPYSEAERAPLGRA